jgi:hypothetical protein
MENNDKIFNQEQWHELKVKNLAHLKKCIVYGKVE